MNFTIDESIKKVIPNCRLGYITVKNATVRGTPPALAQEFGKLQAEVANIYKLDLLTTTPRIIAVRTMYKKLDFDPSRYRPASEALVRRVLKNKSLYYVNSAVDVNNYCSIKYLVPFGLYDLDKIMSNVEYRMVTSGTYVNIASKEVSAGGKPFLTDETGVFGNPTSDARRTAVTLATTNLLSVIYADEEVTDEQLKAILDETANMLILYNGGTIGDKKIIFA